MRVRIKRDVSVPNEYKALFLRLLLTARKDSKAKTGLNPRTYIETETGSNIFDVMALVYFVSVAEHDENPVHQLLKDTSFPHSAESVDKIAVNNLCDKPFVCLEKFNCFINHFGRSDLKKLTQKELITSYKFMIEQVFKPRAGSSREIIDEKFEFAKQLMGSTRIFSPYFCARFSAGCIGVAVAFVGFDDPVTFEAQLTDFEQKLTRSRTSILLCPIGNTSFHSVDEKFVASMKTEGKILELMPQD